MTNNTETNVVTLAKSDWSWIAGIVVTLAITLGTGAITAWSKLAAIEAKVDTIIMDHGRRLDRAEGWIDRHSDHWRREQQTE